jgi:type I restriction enzyme, S subunit
MVVRPGYKLAEVGVIPEDWEVRSVRDIGRVTTGPFGTLLKASEYSGPEGVPLISVGEIGEGEFRVTEHTPRVPTEVVRRLPQYVLRTGDIVFGRKGAVDRSALVCREEQGWFLGSDGISIRPAASCHPPYLAAQLRSGRVKAWLVQNATGTTMASLNQGILRRVQVPYASAAEQHAIATTLSDMDALLGGLDRLIAKKRDLKQAVMQQLLTARTRLPGFHGEWVVKRLGSVAPLQRGFDLPSTQLKQGPYPVVYSNGILNQHAVYQVKGPGVVTGRSGTIGKVTFVEDDYWPHNTSLWVTSFNGNAPRFVFYLYTRIALERFATGSGVPTLNRNDVHSFEVLIPPTVAEQSAIAEVLSDMDAELSLLEASRDKTRALKQGMMQDLLTGKIRLVRAGNAHA